MNPIFNELELFCKDEVLPFISSASKNDYPHELLKRIGELGLFGFNIPKEFGGSSLPANLNIPINRLLSHYSLALPALYGIHLRASQYFTALGTEEQKKVYLTEMAKGKLISTHAYHEKSIRSPKSFTTAIYKKGEKYLLSGTKEWVINAHNCDFMVVIARQESNKISDNSPICSAVIVDRNKVGLTISEEYVRRGLKGISLSRVTFSNVEIDPSEIIGGEYTCASMTALQYSPMPLLNFSARAVGVAESIAELIKKNILDKPNGHSKKDIISYKWSEIQMIKESIVAFFESSLALQKEDNLTQAHAYRTKVFCTKALVRLVEKASMLCGGAGYASDDYLLIQQLEDAASLIFIDTPNDILLTIAGKVELEQV